jgi:hypothetical protein
MNKSKTKKNKGTHKYSKKYRKNGKNLSNKCKRMKSVMYEIQKMQRITEEVRLNNVKLSNKQDKNIDKKDKNSDKKDKNRDKKDKKK